MGLLSQIYNHPPSIRMEIAACWQQNCHTLNFFSGFRCPQKFGHCHCSIEVAGPSRRWPESKCVLSCLVVFICLFIDVYWCQFFDHKVWIFLPRIFFLFFLLRLRIIHSEICPKSPKESYALITEGMFQVNMLTEDSCNTIVGNCNFLHVQSRYLGKRLTTSETSKSTKLSGMQRLLRCQTTPFNSELGQKQNGCRDVRPSTWTCDQFSFLTLFWSKNVTQWRFFNMSTPGKRHKWAGNTFFFQAHPLKK